MYSLVYNLHLREENVISHYLFREEKKNEKFRKVNSNSDKSYFILLCVNYTRDNLFPKHYILDLWICFLN
jgi:hypothetical protein